MIVQSFKISYRNLLAHKLRSFLTVLGVVIGVSSVILIFSIGLSAQELILSELRSTGSNLIAVLPGASDEDGPPAIAYGIVTETLTYDDLEVLLDGKTISEIEQGGGYVRGNVLAKSEQEEKYIPFLGTTASYLDLENAVLEAGRFITEEEERGLARVAVLGSEVAEELFPQTNPLNQKIKLEERNFTVVGVLKEKGSSVLGGTNQDSSVIIPLKTAQKQIAGVDYLNFISLKIKDLEQMNLVKAKVVSQLRSLHNIDDPEDDDFSVRDIGSAIDLITKVTNVLRYFLLTIGVVALIVGGVGIMNIMLISVSQRIREIGVRRAIGARRGDLFWQFLVESSAVSFLGGLIGVLVGIVLAFAVSVVVGKMGYQWDFIISPFSIVTALVISFLVGLIFGIYPARKAAKIEPMEALRYE